VGGQKHAPAALPPRKTRYPLYRRLGGPQGRSGRVGKISPPPGFFFNASFVRILYFVVLVLDFGPLGRSDHLSVLSLVWADILYPRHQELPSLAKEDAAYWPDTQRTPLAKEGTNGIWPAIVLLHAPKLGHGTDYFTSTPKEGMLWIFPAGKIRRLRSGANPRSWEPEASMLTTRPPKPLGFDPRTVQPGP
jgi:hypothetical protein